MLSGNFKGSEIWHVIFWGLVFGPGMFWGFVGSPRDFWVLIFAPI